MGGPVDPPLWFFALYSKNLQATHTWKFLTFPNFWLRIPLWIFFSRNLVYTLWKHFWDTQYNFFFIFCFNLKNFLHTLVDKIFRKRKTCRLKPLQSLLKDKGLKSIFFIMTKEMLTGPFTDDQVKQVYFPFQ